MNPKARNELIGVAALLLGLFFGLTLLQLPLTGSWGRAIGSMLWQMFGLGAVVLPVLGVGWALAAFERLGPLSWGRAAALGAGLILLVPYGIAIGLGPVFPNAYPQWTASQKLVGLFPEFLASGIQGAVGTAGAVLVGLFALSALGIVTVGWHPLAMLRGGQEGRAKGDEEKPAPKTKRATTEPPAPPVSRPPSPVPKDRKSKPLPPSKPAPPPPAGVLLPPIDLLTEPPGAAGDADAAAIEEMGQRLVATLETFRVGAQIIHKTVGPVVTRYELEPGRGVKVGRVSALADDLALAMRAQSLRIVAPIPGKAAIGIEVPNPTPRMVHIRELIDTAEFRRPTRTLPVVLGRNLEGDEVVDDLAKMPHLLIAGATGSGKSVCINAIITSLVYAHPPEKLQLLMIDPKMVELSMYAALPHLGLPVVTSHHKAANVLKWAVWEMERRYKLLHANHARNIADFNRKVEEKKPLKGPRETLATQAGIQKELPFDGEYKDGILPYIVLIVDELADLMLTVQGEIETPLAVLAQKARAIGVHLILATQRPSVNVITGLIKANFPCRIAFRVSAKVDSRTILDQNGAETLLGNGDMLFLPPGKSEPMRVQGAFISTDETERLMDWYKAHARAAVPVPGKPSIDEQVAALEAAAKEGDEGGGMGEGSGERDPLFRQAAEVCIQNQLGSTSLLQRRMSIGYGRAARIIDQLEMAGILGPANGSKPRDVLVGLEELDDIVGASE
ncbi:MAG TPA: DNA translocase FtsK [Gemmatimonadales bacterium]|jgi:S-DNA-T family DNA segregation ATPase FtsK/SpoIIIE|nr:DNA translocase FtsK [Gemmatimonadales bacterium]